MNMLLYIDPGTGSMLFSLFIGIAAAASFGLRALFMKIRFMFSVRKAEEERNERAGLSDSVYPPPLKHDAGIPFAIFSDHKRYWNVFKPICDEFEKRQIPLAYYTASHDDPALTASYRFVRTEFLGDGNRPYAKLNFLRADVLLSTTPGLGVYQWKRSKDVKCYVHIPHAVTDLAGYRMFGLDHYDSVIASGENQLASMRELERLRPSIKAKEFVVVGSTYLDAMRARLETQGRSAASEKKTLLVAPTWGKSGILSRFGEKLLSALAATDFEIIVRPHPQSAVSEKDMLEALQKKFSSFEWNYDNDNFEVLSRSDIMITDFSGVIFDYSLVFDKPVIYADTSYDSLPYDADWLSGPLWEFTVLPKIGIGLKEEQFGQIESVVEKAMRSGQLKSGRDYVRSQAWQNQGGSAVSAADFLIAKQKKVAEGY